MLSRGNTICEKSVRRAGAIFSIRSLFLRVWAVLMAYSFPYLKELSNDMWCARVWSTPNQQTSTHTTTHPTMIAAGAYGPLEPHRRPCVPRRRVGWIGDDPPSKWMCFCGGVEGVHVLQNAPVLWRRIIAGTKERFDGRAPPRPPQ